MQLYGHRGASAQRPENTRAAFELALDAGAVGVECDVRRVKDHIVVLHDSNLRRTGNWHDDELLNASVEDLRLRQVRDVDVGSWFDAKYADQRLLTIHDFLNLVAQRKAKCFVEVKGIEACAREVQGLVFCARLHGVGPSQLTFIGADLMLMTALKLLGPEYPCLGVSYILPVPFLDRILGLAERQALAFVRRCAEAGLDGADFNADVRVVTSRVVEELHSRGMQCAVWAFSAPAKNDRPEVWEAMANLGVDVFTSNCPPEAFKWWEERRAAGGRSPQR